MEPKTKQYLLVTVVGVTLFVALLRLSAVLAFAAELIDLILPILAAVGGDTKRFLERTSKVQWGLMISVFCIRSRRLNC